MLNTGTIYGINGPVIYLKGNTGFRMSEMVYVGKQKLVGEVIALDKDRTTIQVYESTTGLRPGEKLYEEILTKEEGLQKTANNLIYVGQPLEFDEVHFLSELKKLEIAASEESRDVKKIVSGIVSTYHIREEDKERDEEMYEELLSLGKASHEEPVVEDR